MGVPADMYIIGSAARTTAQGGTQLDRLMDGIGRLLYVSGCSLRSVETRLSLTKIKYYIDQGLPVMWTLSSTQTFNDKVNAWNEKRAEVQDQDRWLEICAEEEKYIQDRNEPPMQAGHMCLIIGYNEVSEEICISDSWGEEFARRWVLIEEAATVSRDIFYVISW
jgi:hypothetical protein